MPSRERRLELFIVEDNPADVTLIRQGLKECCRDHDINIRVANDGEEALSTLKSGDYRPSLILLDLNLPKLDGHTILEQMRAGDMVNVPVVVLTSSSSERDIRKALDSGANAYVTKPAELGSFFSVIQSIADLWLKPAPPSHAQA